MATGDGTVAVRQRAGHVLCSNVASGGRSSCEDEERQ